MALSIHNRAVSRKYAKLSPDVYVESLQCEGQSLPLLLHPAVLCRFFSLDFGQRGLSIRNFRLLSVNEARELRHRYNMTDFSTKNVMPAMDSFKTLTELVDALSCLCSVVTIACSAEIVKLSEHARAFVSVLIRNRVSLDALAIDELAYWIDERFEMLRALLAQGEDQACSIVTLNFQ